MYEKCGSCGVLLAVEPLTGRRCVHVTTPRTAQEYSAFMTEVEAAYPEADQITLVQDNLNTHHGGSFSTFMTPEAAHRLVGRFEWVCTPKHASWLTMAELEFSALSRQCLNRRRPSEERLRAEVIPWVEQRDRAKVKLVWQFTVHAARTKFSRHYESVRIN
ncbi:transposase [Deinococcus sp. Arct2-2]|uniref:transposase n=1 Tax=Deinococcus sp. Arct2-2 TaxID=2568653 RepID=UPI001454D3A7|nr:transposase [Deinococcus sp. Arct2-2]